MQRRQVVRSLGLLAVGAAGCSEAPAPAPAPPTGTPSDPDDDSSGGGGLTTRQPLQVRNDYTISESADGNVRIDLTVTNPASVDRMAILRVTASLDGNDVEQEQRLDLASGESTDLSFVFELDYGAWQDSATSLDFTFDY